MATEIVRAADRADTYALRYNEANRYQLTANCGSSSLSLVISKNRSIPITYIHARTQVQSEFFTIDIISEANEVEHPPSIFIIQNFLEILPEVFYSFVKLQDARSFEFHDTYKEIIITAILSGISV